MNARDATGCSDDRPLGELSCPNEECLVKNLSLRILRAMEHETDAEQKSDKEHAFAVVKERQSSTWRAGSGNPRVGGFDMNARDANGGSDDRPLWDLS